MPTNAQMTETVRKSMICLRASYAAAVRITELAEKLPPSLRPRAVPYTVQPEVEAAYARAAEVIAFNARPR